MLQCPAHTVSSVLRFLRSRVAIAAAALIAVAPAAFAQSIITVAGGGTTTQEGLPAKAVIFPSVLGLAADRDG